jgi:hypothetical protein
VVTDISTDLGVGDAETATLTVSPADVTTAVTLTVHKPDTTSTTVTMTAGALVPIPDTSPTEYSQTWTADDPIVYTQAGHWVLHYDVTGTGEGAEDLDVFVVPSPVAGGPTWAPGRSKVATYVPHRTLARSTSSIIDSQDEYVLTFDQTTRPTGLQTDALIVDAVAWVAARVSPLQTTMHDLARAVAALLTAAWIERSWPNDDQSLQRANDMEKRLDRLMADLIDANNSAGGTGDYGIDVAAVWAFPAADCRWDSPNYW